MNSALVSFEYLEISLNLVGNVGITQFLLLEISM